MRNIALARCIKKAYCHIPFGVTRSPGGAVRQIERDTHRGERDGDPGLRSAGRESCYYLHPGDSRFDGRNGPPKDTDVMRTIRIEPLRKG